MVETIYGSSDAEGAMDDGIAAAVAGNRGFGWCREGRKVVGDGSERSKTRRRQKQSHISSPQDSSRLSTVRTYIYTYIYVYIYIYVCIRIYTHVYV